MSWVYHCIWRCGRAKLLYVYSLPAHVTSRDHQTCYVSWRGRSNPRLRSQAWWGGKGFWRGMVRPVQLAAVLILEGRESFLLSCRGLKSAHTVLFEEGVISRRSSLPKYVLSLSHHSCCPNVQTQAGRGGPRRVAYIRSLNITYGFFSSGASLCFAQPLVALLPSRVPLVPLPPFHAIYTSSAPSVQRHLHSHRHDIASMVSQLVHQVIRTDESSRPKARQRLGPIATIETIPIEVANPTIMSLNSIEAQTPGLHRFASKSHFQRSRARRAIQSWIPSCQLHESIQTLATTTACIEIIYNCINSI